MRCSAATLLRTRPHKGLVPDSVQPPPGGRQRIKASWPPRGIILARPDVCQAGSPPGTAFSRSLQRVLRQAPLDTVPSAPTRDARVCEFPFVVSNVTSAGRTEHRTVTPHIQKPSCYLDARRTTGRQSRILRMKRPSPPGALPSLHSPVGAFSYPHTIDAWWGAIVMLRKPGP